MTKYEADQIFKSRLQNEDYNTIAKRMSIKMNIPLRLSTSLAIKRTPRAIL